MMMIKSQVPFDRYTSAVKKQMWDHIRKADNQCLFSKDIFRLITGFYSYFCYFYLFPEAYYCKKETRDTVYLTVKTTLNSFLQNVNGAMNRHEIGSNPSGLAHDSGHCDTPEKMGELPSLWGKLGTSPPREAACQPWRQGAPITTALTHQEPALSGDPSKYKSY